MTITQLDTPLRATWELHALAGEISPQAELVAEKLVDAGLFYVTLVAQPLAHPAIAGILTILRSGGILVQATFAGSEAEWQGLASLEEPLPEIAIDANAILVRGDDQEWDSLRQTLERLRQFSAHPALWMVPDRERLPLLPQLCDFGRRQGVTRIKLPNTPVDASFSARHARSLPTPAQLAALRKVIIDPVALRSGLTLEVHDLFLWEILFPGERENGRSEYGGCQAANSLAHIAANGMVHPCSSWPYALGSLLEQDFAAIWQQRERAVILEKIAALPDGCAGCGDYEQCFGGCRGLVETLGNVDNGRDLLCAGRRPSSPHGSD